MCVASHILCPVQGKGLYSGLQNISRNINNPLKRDEDFNPDIKYEENFHPNIKYGENFNWLKYGENLILGKYSINSNNWLNQPKEKDFI